MLVPHVCIFTHVLLAACGLCGWRCIAGKYVGACLLPLRLLQVVGRVGGGGGDAGGRRGTTPISFGMCCALQAAASPAAKRLHVVPAVLRLCAYWRFMTKVVV